MTVDSGRATETVVDDSPKRVAATRRFRRSRRATARPHVLILDANVCVPNDRRVWLECQALVADGFDVSVICPRWPGTSSYEELSGVRIYRYRTSAEPGTVTSYVLDYTLSWLRTVRLTRKVWRRNPFHVIQSCNPPDTYFLIAWFFKRVGVRFLFDQHDLCPEVYQDRFGNAYRYVRSILLVLEKLTHRTADHVITVNESCKDLLLSRTSTTRDKLTVVRTGPDLQRLRRVSPQNEFKNGRKFLCSYLGVMGPQDGVDMVIRAVDVLVHDLQRQDIHFVLMGSGGCLSSLTDLTAQLKVEPWVHFTGFADDGTISSYLSASDLGLQPDPKTAFTDLCSMLKTIEYMAFGLPVVAFDLAETRRTAEGAALYVPEETPKAYAQAILTLLDRPDRRAAMSDIAHRRARDALSWEQYKRTYVTVVRTLCRADRAEDAG